MDPRQPGSGLLEDPIAPMPGPSKQDATVVRFPAPPPPTPLTGIGELVNRLSKWSNAYNDWEPVGMHNGRVTDRERHVNEMPRPLKLTDAEKLYRHDDLIRALQSVAATDVQRIRDAADLAEVAFLAVNVIERHELRGPTRRPSLPPINVSHDEAMWLLHSALSALVSGLRRLELSA